MLTTLGGWKKSASATDAAVATNIGTRNNPLKLIALVAASVNFSCINHGQIEFASNAPTPRIITLNNPCALARASLGKYASTKI